MNRPEYYEDEDGILRGRCSRHGEFVGDAIGCPQCFAEGEERDAMDKCGHCRCEITPGTEAISREDNKTLLCSDCGQAEALGDRYP